MIDDNKIEAAKEEIYEDRFLLNDEVRGIVYCQDKDTKEPVWIEPWSDECCSWWHVCRVPKFYKDKSLVRKVIY